MKRGVYKTKDFINLYAGPWTRYCQTIGSACYKDKDPDHDLAAERKILTDPYSETKSMSYVYIFLDIQQYFLGKQPKKLCRE